MQGDSVNSVRRVVNQGAKLRLRFHEFLFDSFSVGYVSGDCGSTNDRSLRILHGRNSHRDVYSLALLTDPHRFIMLDPLVLLEPFQDLRNLVALFAWHQNTNWMAHDFARRVAIDSLRTGIPAHDLPIQGLSDDCVVRRFDNGCQLR